MGMSREEAIEEVKNYENYPNGLSKECRDYIIKALEQEPIIDKIREEIENIDTSYYSSVNGVDMVECADDMKHGILEIFDKYKAERNDKECQIIFLKN